MSTNMRGGWKVTAGEYNNQMSIEQRYRQTPQWKAKNNFNIFAVLLAIVLLFIFG